ncbi:MAG TPA: NADH-quinone oxidoreductase subunit M [Anaerolineae bacterium]|nr:NADH-quinone oxidoreductase subunit M [Anaerolineae bacterium]
MEYLLTIITFVPLLGVVLIMLIPREEERTIKNIAIGLSFIPLLLATYLWFAFEKGGPAFQFELLAPWIPSLNINYHVGADGLSVPLVFLTTLLTTLCLVYSSYTIKVRVKEFFLLFLLLEMGMIGVFISLDLVLFYVFWEIGLVPMYLMIGIWGQPKDRPQYSAIKFFLYTLAGSVFMLLAILGLYFFHNTFDIVELSQGLGRGNVLGPVFAGNSTYAILAFWAFFIPFAIKVPLWPFHTWLPDAHTAAPTAGSVILAGVLLKLGAFGMLRIALPIFPEQFQFYSWNVPIIPILALFSIVYGALVCMAQWDLKRLIAYSSVSHMGYVMLGISAAAAGWGVNAFREAAAMASNGAALQMFNHGIITGGLFFLVGVIYERAHTRDLALMSPTGEPVRDADGKVIPAFGGLGKMTPYYYGLFLVTAFASLGLPGLAGFWAEFFVFRGAFEIMPWFAAIGILGIIVTAAYILWKIVQYVFLGEFDAERWKAISHGAILTDVMAFEKATLWPLVVFMIGFGVYPTPLVDFFNDFAQKLFGG